MTCHLTSEVDLLGFLEDPAADTFASFREHYPRCETCSGEVRAFGELRSVLVGGREAAIHPPPELLCRYEEDAAGLGAPERADLERHLESCAPCRDELRALRAFDPAQLAARVLATPAPRSAIERLRDALAALGRLAWSPAFAYALVALLLLPVLQQRLAPDLLGPRRPVETHAPLESATTVDPEALRELARELVDDASGAHANAPALAPPPPREERLAAAAEPSGAPTLERSTRSHPGKHSEAAPRARLRAAQPSAEERARVTGDVAIASEERKAMRAPDLDVAVAEPVAAGEAGGRLYAARAPAPARAPAAAPPEAPARSGFAAAEVASEELQLGSEDLQLESDELMLGAVLASPPAPGAVRVLSKSAPLLVTEAAITHFPAERALRGGSLAIPTATATVARDAPARSDEAGVLEIRIVDATRRRELREAVSAAPGWSHEIRVPPGWLLPGDYTVELRLADATGVDLVRSYRVRVDESAPTAR